MCCTEQKQNCERPDSQLGKTKEPTQKADNFTTKGDFWKSTFYKEQSKERGKRARVDWIVKIKRIGVGRHRNWRSAAKTASDIAVFIRYWWAFDESSAGGQKAWENIRNEAWTAREGFGNDNERNCSKAKGNDRLPSNNRRPEKPAHQRPRTSQNLGWSLLVRIAERKVKIHGFAEKFDWVQVNTKLILHQNK